ncbi:TRAP transporter substrate-binding protein DctP [Thermodesulfobacteriota bacterium]
MVKRLIAMVVVCFIIVIVSGISVYASEKPIVLRYGSMFPPKHGYSLADTEFLNMIEKKSNGQVKFKTYFANTLTTLREAYRDIQKGSADLAYFSASYSKAGFPIQRRITGFYHGITDPQVRLKIFLEIIKKYPEYAKEFTKIKPIGCAVGLHYALLSTKPLRTIDDMKGLQFKATGTYIAILNALGVVGQNLPMADVYISLQKGLIDGAMAPKETLKSRRLAEVIKSVADSPIITGAYYSRGMNLDVWNKLPSDVQKLFDDNMIYWGELLDIRARERDQEGIDLAKEHGVEFYKFSKADLERFNSVIEKTCIKLAKDLDDKGLPGTAIYKDIRSMAKQHGF